MISRRPNSLASTDIEPGPNSTSEVAITLIRIAGSAESNRFNPGGATQAAARPTGARPTGAQANGVISPMRSSAPQSNKDPPNTLEANGEGRESAK